MKDTASEETFIAWGVCEGEARLIQDDEPDLCEALLAALAACGALATVTRARAPLMSPTQAPPLTGGNPLSADDNDPGTSRCAVPPSAECVCKLCRCPGDCAARLARRRPVALRAHAVLAPEPWVG